MSFPDCIEWRGARDRDGYGVYGYPQERVPRMAWELSRAMPIPADLIVLHSCDNPACYNPNHLYLGTWKMNMEDRIERGRNPQLNKTHCPQGHEYDYIDPRGHRQCKICRREACSRSYYRRKNA